MEWPVLGRARVATRKRCLPEDQPGPSKKPRKEQCHWNMKLAMIFEKKQLPEVVEKLIEEYAFHEKFRKFFASYGIQRAMYAGPGFVSGWHPRVACTKRDRYIWCIFSTSRMDVYRLWPNTMDMATAKPLEGRTVLIVYRNRHGNITRMDPKRVLFASAERMHLDDGPDTVGFNVYYSGVMSIDLFVDIARNASDR